MNPEPIEPLPSDIADLIEEANRARQEDPILSAAVLSGVERAIVLALPLARIPNTKMEPAHNALAAARKVVMAKVAAGFVVGALVGGGVTQALNRHAPVHGIGIPSVPAIASSLPFEVENPATTGGGSPPAPTSLAPAPYAATKPHRAQVAAAEAPDELERERDAVAAARAALVRGRADDALSATENHRRQWPRGQLVEERELLAIQALVMAHRAGEASERASRFRLLFPKSVFLPAIDVALRGGAEK